MPTTTRLISRRNVVAVAVGVGVAVAYAHNRAHPVHNDAGSKKYVFRWPAQSRDHLQSLVWGSNKSNVLSQESQTIRNPCNVEWLQDLPLRDLVLHEHHAACVDARGDVYQWGDAFHKDATVPAPSLSGKHIITLQLTANKLIALSSTGKIYVLPVHKSSQTASESVSSWSTWLFGSTDRSRHVELRTDSKLARGEKFVSISAGTDHLLALTSSGRTFTHPLSIQANSYGQLGIRKFDVPCPADSSRKQIELIPKSFAIPFRNKTPFARSSIPLAASALRVSQSSASASEVLNTDEAEFLSDKLFEIPSLKGIRIAQAVAGARSSYVRTVEEGRVLAWGANQYGQLGLGAAVTVDTITIPTEIVFTRSAPAGSRSRCIGICTGGDLTFFLVERRDGTFMPTTDLLACGMGQWGGLGNGVFTTAQSVPSKVRAVSGLLEFSEQTQNLQAIVPHALSVSPTGHVLLTLDTLTRSGSSSGEFRESGSGLGRDLFTWGKNHDYELGTGNRASLATPVTLDLDVNTSTVEVSSGENSSPSPNPSSNSSPSRVMLLKRKVDVVRDLRGDIWKKKVEVEQCAVAGYSSSMVYWRICGY